MPTKNTSPKAAFDVTKYFALHDIVLWTTSLRRERDFQPELHQGKCATQSMRSVRPEFISALLEGDDEERNMLRALVTLGVREVFRDEEADEEIVLHSLEATFAVDYFLAEVLPSQKDFNGFVEFNCVHNVWPFWRQHVYDTFKRASLPVPIIPLFMGGASKKSKPQLRRTEKKLAVTSKKAHRKAG